MERIYSDELIEGKVIVGGWVNEIRSFGGIKFISLRDRNGLMQITLPKKEVSEELFSLIDSITKE
ncbi:MAG: OB-fold nucleic acid binding domain-containing protein, partial [Candidatus Diapherotrites archaeon]